MRFFPLLFLLLLVAEVWSIVQVGHRIGALATFILLVAGFMFGTQLMRSQGISALRNSAQQMQDGQSPLAPLAAAVINAFAGILLIFPGFVSDVIALVLLLPFVRGAIVKQLLNKSQFQGFAAGNFGAGGNPFMQGGFGAFGAANEDMNRGNVYEHDGSAKPADKIIEGQVIEFKPDDKP